MTDSQPEEVAAPKNEEAATGQNPLFKAVGVIQGEVNLSEDGIHTVTFDKKTYRLKFASEKRATLYALKQEIRNTGNKFQRLIVYPRIIHFPKRGQPPVFYFELVGFERRAVTDRGILNELSDLEFKLSGLWQFIPVSQVPCVSIFKNFTEARKLYIKQVEPVVKVRFMKAAHLPLFWRDAPIAPFRYNPRIPKEEQGRAKFVQIKARFLPQRNTFAFMEQMAEPLEEIPRFLKASKSDKEEQRKNAAAHNKKKLNQQPSAQPSQQPLPEIRRETPKPIKKNKPQEQ